MLKPPAYLANEIRERVKQLDVQAVATVKKTSRKIQLLLYSMKVGAAVAFSILILGVTANIGEMGPSQIRQPGAPMVGQDQLDLMSRASNGVTDWMNQFSSMLLNGGKE